MGNISGYQIDLSEGRHVFYAQHDGLNYFRFRNREGFETKFKLSDEANDALIDLLTGPKEISRRILHLKETAGSWEKIMECAVVVTDPPSPQATAEPEK